MFFLFLRKVALDNSPVQRTVCDLHGAFAVENIAATEPLPLLGAGRDKNIAITLRGWSLHGILDLKEAVRKKFAFLCSLC
jgi:hypothetical protein